MGKSISQERELRALNKKIDVLHEDLDAVTRENESLKRVGSGRKEVMEAVSRCNQAAQHRHYVDAEYDVLRDKIRLLRDVLRLEMAKSEYYARMGAGVKPWDCLLPAEKRSHLEEVDRTCES